MTEKESKADSEGYELLSRFGRERLEAIYGKVATRGRKRDHCPESFKDGVRLINLIEEFEQGFREMVDDRTDFLQIAAWSFHFFIFRQPLKNCNHRTGYGIMKWVLTCFGYKLRIKPEEDALEFFKKFEGGGVSVEEVKEWMVQNVSANRSRNSPSSSMRS
ncbi:MAG: hypothetical protein ACE5QF_07460 [Thermoplasmata archaeon]